MYDKHFLLISLRITSAVANLLNCSWQRGFTRTGWIYWAEKLWRTKVDRMVLGGERMTIPSSPVFCFWLHPGWPGQMIL